MEITLEQYKRIEKYFPLQRGNVNMDNVQLLNALLYVVEANVNKPVATAGINVFNDTFIRDTP